MLGYFLIFIWSSGHAQTGKRWYYNIDTNNVAIDGYDVVAYFKQNEAIKGKSTFKETYQEVVYYFANAQHQQLFRQKPTQFLPRYGGWCALIAGADPRQLGLPPTRSKPDPASFKIVANQLYLFVKTPRFSGLKRWEKDQKATQKRADRFWKSRVKLAQKFPQKPKALHPLARMENLVWNPFIGKWKATSHIMNDTLKKTYVIARAQWDFHYGYKGFCIQDDWVPAYSANSGLYAGPAYRMYDPFGKVWKMMYIPVNQPEQYHWKMEGNYNFEKDQFEIEATSTDGQGRKFIQKIYFYDIKPNKFSWRGSRSYDGGKTWIKKFQYAECERI